MPNKFKLIVRVAADAGSIIGGVAVVAQLLASIGISSPNHKPPQPESQAVCSWWQP